MGEQIDLQARRRRNLAQARGVIAPEMVVDGIMRAPHPFIGGDGNQDAAAGFELGLDAGKCRKISINVFQHIEKNNKIVEIFKRLGFAVQEDREIEDDWHNFTALNMPEDHPARDMQDTFFVNINPDIVLRTHTSSVQVRVMENQKPPIRILSPGRVFRNETISARSHCFFHQVEGLYIDEDVSFADLLQTLDFFVKELFGQDIKIKVRPSYFPFTEPSAEVDVTCFICGGKGCNVCKYSGWVEILGCGMVDPKVLENCNIDSKKYSGFAFGMGVERITMLKYQIKDIRLLSENDTRFLEQFKAAR